MYPTELKYNHEHTWLKLEGDNLGRVGITDFAQEQLKTVVFVELPDVGTETAYLEPFGLIESVKATNDLYSPATGEVVEVNQDLANEPGLVNQDPYGKGWMIVIRLKNPAELDLLVSAEAYQATIGGKAAE
ncbi:MAG: glycine cleavage system protein GcvH [Deltaproteobacteria bacterium]|nr:glycine cleavage system protein GcvH [Deltaproteobacteria bacterium]